MSEILEVRKEFVNSARELDVYKRSYALSLTLHKRSLEFPKIEQYALADQIRRASKSICANLSEGFAKQRFSPADFKRFIGMSIGSCAEVQVWVEYCFDLGYISDVELSEWITEYNVIIKMLTKLRDKIDV